MAASQPRSDAMIYVVMGVSGSGKSMIGAGIAHALSMPFVEGDALHPASNVAKMAQGTPLTDDDRFPWLDRIGAEIAGAGAEGLVVSCSSLKKVYRDRLRSFAEGRVNFVFLKGSEAVLAERMSARRGHFMPASLLKSQLATLEDPTGEPGVITIDVSPPPERVIVAALQAIAGSKAGEESAIIANA
ncbi:gluconokinase [Rhizobium sp.]